MNQKKSLPFFCKNEKIGSRRVDLVFDNNVIVETRALTRLKDIHLAQPLITWRLLIQEWAC